MIQNLECIGNLIAVITGFQAHYYTGQGVRILEGVCAWENTNDPLFQDTRTLPVCCSKLDAF